MCPIFSLENSISKEPHARYVIIKYWTFSFYYHSSFFTLINSRHCDSIQEFRPFFSSHCLNFALTLIKLSPPFFPPRIFSLYFPSLLYSSPITHTSHDLLLSLQTVLKDGKRYKVNERTFPNYCSSALLSFALEKKERGKRERIEGGKEKRGKKGGKRGNKEKKERNFRSNYFRY